MSCYVVKKKEKVIKKNVSTSAMKTNLDEQQILMVFETLSYLPFLQLFTILSKIILKNLHVWPGTEGPKLWNYTSPHF